MKVVANLYINGVKTENRNIDVPTDKCNREDFIEYIRQYLLDSLDIKVNFELGDMGVNSK